MRNATGPRDETQNGHLDLHQGRQLLPNSRRCCFVCLFVFFYFVSCLVVVANRKIKMLITK